VISNLPEHMKVALSKKKAVKAAEDMKKAAKSPKGAKKAMNTAMKVKMDRQPQRQAGGRKVHH
jgi:hypothetical protein